MAAQHSTESPIPVWKAIDGYEGIYEISSFGGVRSLDRFILQLSPLGHVVRRSYPGSTLKAVADNHGYIRVSLAKPGQKAETKRVHHLVAMVFIGPRPEGYSVCHIDGDKTNNTLLNLRYGTQSENEADKLAHGRLKHGQRHAEAKLDDETVRRLRSDLQGKTQSWWAHHLRVSEAALSRALSYKTWRHINSPTMRDPHQ